MLLFFRLLLAATVITTLFTAPLIALAGHPLVPYESTTVSYAHEDDEWFLDYKMSVQFGISDAIDDFFEGHKKLRFDSLRAAMTLTGGFYVPSRYSSPVIGKRFNPKIFARSYFAKTGYIDIGLCHESNGQSISSENELDAAMRETDSHDDKPDTARDLVSRSWNFFEVKIGTSKLLDGNWYGEITITDPFSGDIGIGRKVLPRWERELLNGTHRNKHNVTSRAQVHGITLLVGRESQKDREFAFDVLLKTGIRNPERLFSSVQVGVSFVLWPGKVPLPIYFHYFNGFASDLAEFYRESASFGVGLRFSAHRTQREG